MVFFHAVIFVVEDHFKEGRVHWDSGAGIVDLLLCVSYGAMGFQEGLVHDFGEPYLTTFGHPPEGDHLRLMLP